MEIEEDQEKAGQEMTDAQLYTAIGVPVIALIFAMVANFAMISRMDKRIEDMRDLLRAEIRASTVELVAKLTDIEHRLDRIESERRVIS